MSEAPDAVHPIRVRLTGASVFMWLNEWEVKCNALGSPLKENERKGNERARKLSEEPLWNVCGLCVSKMLRKFGTDEEQAGARSQELWQHEGPYDRHCRSTACDEDCNCQRTAVCALTPRTVKSPPMKA